MDPEEVGFNFLPLLRNDLGKGSMKGSEEEYLVRRTVKNQGLEEA